MDCVFVGAGAVAEKCAAGLEESSLDLQAVCDLQEKRAGALAGSHGATAYTDLDAMLSAESAPIVLNLTSHGAHAEVTRRSLEAGPGVVQVGGSGREYVPAPDPRPGPDGCYLDGAESLARAFNIGREGAQGSNAHGEIEECNGADQDREKDGRTVAAENPTGPSDGHEAKRLVGARRAAHIVANLAAAGTQLTDTEMARIADLADPEFQR